MELALLWMVPLIIFTISFIIEPRQLKNSLLFSLTIMMFLVANFAWLVVKLETLGWYKVALTIGIIFLMLIPVFILLSCLFLLFNSRTILKKEGLRIANMLSLFYGMSILILLISPLLPDYKWISKLLFLLFFIVAYFSFIYISHILYTIFYIKWPLFKQPDFIIVLGSGLIGDQVPPLLAQRLNKGIAIYHKYQQEPRFVVSGGQGEDEWISEAEAMRLYLLDRGIPDDAIIVENQSTTTLENLTFSKHLLDKIKKDYYTVVVTNSFHVLRASIYARRVGLKGKGIGSKTVLYYMPSALIRENIGLLVMFKYWHMIILLVTIIPFILFEIINLIWHITDKI